jgi:hypothetical protein
MTEFGLTERALSGLYAALSSPSTTPIVLEGYEMTITFRGGSTVTVRTEQELLDAIALFKAAQERRA